MWTRSVRKAGRGLSAVALALLATTSVGSAQVGAAQGEAGESAVWKPKELNFTYMGFTTRYSCEGLASKVKTVLLALGARKDVVAFGTGCAASYGRPTPFPGVQIRMNVLEPAPAVPAGGTGDPAAVPAHWKSVDLKLDRDPVSEAGECELVEQIKQKIIPLFAARSVEFKSNCVPHQLSPGGTWLVAQVLTPDPVTPSGGAVAPH